MQIKTTVRCQPHTCKKGYCQKDKSVGEDVEKGEALCTVGGMEMNQTIRENSMEVPQKVKNRATM